MNSSDAVYSADITSLPLVHRGKVRDIFAVGDEHLLFVASDRVSAFDVILPTPVPGKGKLLTQIADFWFDHLAGTVALWCNISRPRARGRRGDMSHKVGRKSGTAAGRPCATCSATRPNWPRPRAGR